MLVSLRDDQIEYSSGGRSWAMPVADLRIIAELTTDYGPFLDDWLVIFVAADGSWRQVPIGDDVFALLKVLERRLNASNLVPIALCGGADFDSRIFWPPDLAGRPLFDFPEHPPEGWEDRVREAMAGQDFLNGSRLTQAARAALGLP